MLVTSGNVIYIALSMLVKLKIYGSDSENRYFRDRRGLQNEGCISGTSAVKEDPRTVTLALETCDFVCTSFRTSSKVACPSDNIQHS